METSQTSESCNRDTTIQIHKTKTNNNCNKSSFCQ